MPRQPRQKSESGIYHIMLRGINQQVILEEDEDYDKFLETLEKYKTVSGYKIYAYCLMSNHIHILLKVGKEDLEQIMKRIAGSYVYWYNWKYYRKGHLFQDRFKSEPVENDEHFLTVMRYIHQNPVKAELVETVSEYKYSSYGEHKGTVLLCRTVPLCPVTMAEILRRAQKGETGFKTIWKLLNDGRFKK